MITPRTVANTFARSVLDLIKEDRVESALELAADGVRTYPTYIGGYALLAECYAKLGHTDDATVILDEAERRFPNRQVLVEKRKLIVQTPVPVAEPEDAAAQEPVAEPEPQVHEEQEEPPAQIKQEMVVRRRKERPKESPEVVERKESPLRIIELAPPSSDSRVIRSSSVRLIPGLEFTSLRFEGHSSRGGRSVSVLPSAPPWRTFNKPPHVPATGAPASAGKKVSLEELADKINRVRLTASELEKRPPAPDPIADGPRPSLVTDTLANIYEQQKNYAKAIEAYTLLKEQKPEKAAEYEKRIQACITARDAEANQ